MVPTYYILLTLFLVLSLFLVLLILLQKGRGGGLASAFGGVGGNTAFGAKTGDVLTWATSIVFAVFVILAIVLNLIANSVHERETARVRTNAPAVVDPANVPANIDDVQRHSTTTSPTTGPLFPTDPTTAPTTAPAITVPAAPAPTATTVPAAAAPATAPATTQPEFPGVHLAQVPDMIVSMTGFGDAATARNATHYAVEIRSLNNRFFKPVIKLPDIVSGLEPEIESKLRDRLGRGSITCIMKMRVEGADAAYIINKDALETYLAQLRSIQGLDGIARIDLAALLALPGVCQEPTDDADHLEKHGPVIHELIDKAIEKLQGMRQREGQALYEDLLRHAQVIATNLSEIEKRAPFVIDEYHKRLSNRVQELLSKAQMQVAQIDLLKEVAVFAERSDISEEIQRLRHHLTAFEQACRTNEHAGRKLDFITQEMLREANTIGSKANDAHIAGNVVEIKGSIDRMKEQVQNVE